MFSWSGDLVLVKHLWHTGEVMLVSVKKTYICIYIFRAMFLPLRILPHKFILGSAEGQFVVCKYRECH